MIIGKDIQPILVAIDFSADSEEVLLWAVNYSKCNKAPLIILHIIHDPANSPGFYHKDKDWDKPMDGVANRMADDFIKKMHDKHPSLTPLKEARMVFGAGLPPGRIIEYAKKEQAQIIVMGSCGRSGLANFLSGSVSCRVARLSEVPVVIVKNKDIISDSRLGFCRFKNEN